MTLQKIDDETPVKGYVFELRDENQLALAKYFQEKDDKRMQRQTVSTYRVMDFIHKIHGKHELKKELSKYVKDENVYVRDSATDYF